jgi:hypothetical protein
MIGKHLLVNAFRLGSLTAVICGVALGQQGWAPLQPIKTGSADSGISSVYYDGDDIWVVGAHGLIATSQRWADVSRDKPGCRCGTQ